MKSKRMKWTGKVIQLGEIRNTYSFLVGKPEGKSLLGRLSIDGKVISEWETGWEGVDWMPLAQDRDQW